MARKSLPRQFTKVSEVVEAGLLKGGFYLLEGVTKETEKAIAVPAVGHNEFGYPCRKTAWFPKTQIVKLANDFYTNDAPAEMWMAPAWLIGAKKAEGLNVFETI